MMWDVRILASSLVIGCVALLSAPAPGASATAEFSAAAKKQHSGKSAGGGHRAAKGGGRASGHSHRHASGGHKGGSVGLKSGKLGSGGSLKSGPGKSGATDAGGSAGKLNDGPAKGGSSAKLNTGPGADKRTGRIYQENMGPTDSGTPASPPKDPATKKLIDDFTSTKIRVISKLKERYPGRTFTDQELNAATITVLKRNADEEKRKAWWAWKKKDNEDTNRLRKEQQAKENFNPNAEVYRDSGVTPQEHEELNQRSLPGKPNGSE